MPVLVAIISCQQYNQRRDWMRQAWLHSCPFDYKFFVGGSFLKDNADVITLDCPDDYYHLPEKTIAIVRWALSHGYDRLLKMDDDVYCRPERIVIPEEDYVGHCYGHKEYCSGAAYWLSLKAMNVLDKHWERRTNAEDMCVGETLKFNGINITEDHRYRIGWKSFPKDEGENEFPHPDNDTITFHLYFPHKMIEMHENWTTKQYIDIHTR